jgi:hypothetical protein
MQSIKIVPNRCNRLNKATAQTGTTVGARVFKSRTAGWKSVGIRKESPATGQLDQGFSVVFLEPTANSTSQHASMNCNYENSPQGLYQLY